MKFYKIIFIFISCIISICFSACQPTPNHTPIIGKNDGKLEQIVKQTSDNYHLTFPNNWKESILNSQGKVDVQIDAKIEIPRVSSYPVINVVPAELTDLNLEQMMQNFFQSKVLYLDTGEKTKSELQRELLQAKADEISLQQSGKVHYDSKTFTSEEIPSELNGIKYRINTLKTKIVNAKTEIKRTPFKELKSNEKGEIYCNLVDKANDEYNSILSLQNNKDTKTVYICFNIPSCPYKTNSVFKEKPKDLDITSDNAENIAKKMLSSIGLNNVYTVGKYIGYYYGLDNKFTSVKNSEHCYIFYFSRLVGGIPITYIDGYEGTTCFENGASSPWNPETIEVDVNNNGIIKFQWINPGVLKDTVNKNVRLLTWDVIKERAIQQFRIKNNDQYIFGSDTQSSIVKIDTITLGMMHVAKKDDQTEYMYIPVWDFFGNFYDDNGKQLNSEQAYSILTINAIDGSIIDRGLGY